MSLRPAFAVSHPALLVTTMHVAHHGMQHTALHRCNAEHVTNRGPGCSCMWEQPHSTLPAAAQQGVPSAQAGNLQALDDEEDAVIAEAVRFLSVVVASRQLRRRALLRVVTRVSAGRCSAVLRAPSTVGAQTPRKHTAVRC